MSDLDDNDVMSVALRLTRRGYYVVPLVYGSKAARDKDWPNLRLRESEIPRAFDPARDPGIGILLGVGTNQLRVLTALDVDMDDELLISRVRHAVAGPMPAKRGSKGINFFAASTQPFRAMHLKRPDGVTGKLITVMDILSKGEQCVIPPSIHPGTNQPYQWIGRPLWEFDIEDLPIVGQWELDEITLAVKTPDNPLFQINEMRGKSETEAGSVHDSVLSATSVMVNRGWPDEAIWRRIERATQHCIDTTGYEPPPNWEDQVRRMIEDARLKGFDKSSSSKQQHVAAAEWMLSQWRGPDTVFNLDGAVAAYKDGHFEVLSPYNVRHAIALNCPIKLDGHSHWENVHKTLLDRMPILEPIENRFRVCLQNGTLDMDTGQLNDWSRNDRLLTALPFKFDPEAECPAYDAFMARAMEGPCCEQNIQMFEEFVAYTLQPDQRHQKMLILQGKPATGKSLMLKIVDMLHGKTTVTAVSTSKWGDEKYSAHMVGKLVNLSAEVGALSFVSDEFIKAVTVGDKIVVRHLYQPPMQVVLPTKFIVACNNMFKLRDDSGGPERRFLMIPCNNVIPQEEQDPNLSDKLKNDLPGIFNRIVAAWHRLSARGHFNPPDTHTEALDEFRLENNNVLQWYQDRTYQGMKKANPEVELPKELPPTENSMLFADYVEWAKFHQFKPITSVTFGMRLSNINDDYKTRVTTVGGKSVRVRYLTLTNNNF